MAKSFENIKGTNESTLMLVDCLNLCFRYAHAKSENFAEDFVRVIDSLKRSYKAGQVILCADKGSSRYRKEIYPEYKANRKEKFETQTQEEKERFERFFAEYERALLQAETVYPLLRFDGVEADDIVAYICTQIKKVPVTDIWLISSDRDYDLLITEQISRFSYITRKETTWDNWHTHYDYDPEDHISVKCLMGDSGDNVKGVDGIGPKRAVELVKQYGTAMDIAAELPIQSKYKYIQNLNKCKDLILLNYQLMDLVSFCDLALGEDNCKTINNLLESLYAA